MIDYRDIIINREAGTVFLRRNGMALDLGAIAKGYAADELVKIISRKGVKRAIIDLGGDIFAFGERKVNKSFGEILSGFFTDSGKSSGENTGSEIDEGFWRIGIQDPADNRGFYIGILRVKNRSVVTSGNYERYFEKDGKRYHHIMSAESGYPAETGLLSVTVAADACIDADALSTAAFALGWERGGALVDSVPGAGAIFVFEDMTIRLSENIENFFTLTTGEYRIVKGH